MIEPYIPQTWENLPLRTTPVSAARLSYVEQGIKKLSIEANKTATPSETGVVKVDGTSITVDENGTISTAQQTGDYASKEIYENEAISLGRKQQTTTGQYSVAAGGNTTASGAYSQSFGLNTVSGGEASHVEGKDNIEDVGTANHISGYSNRITGGSYCHVSGDRNEITGQSIFAHGGGLKASGGYTAVFGMYNDVSMTNNMAFVIGRGSSNENRKNIVTIAPSGSTLFAGDVTVTGNDGGTISVYSLKQEVASRYNSLQSQINSRCDSLQSQINSIKEEISQKILGGAS